MKLKFLYALSLLLCLSTFASSNERARCICPAKVSCDLRTSGTPKDTVRSVVREKLTPLATSLPILRLLSI